jgi:hypothetical protein
MKHFPLIIVLLLSSCKDRGVEPAPPKPVVTLTAEDIGVTEVWFSLKTQNVTLLSAVTVQRNNTTIAAFTLATNDTLLVDTTALPKQTYTYKAILQSDSSTPLQVTTMDTTSHNFTWQTFTFGGEAGAGNSILNDVAIVNDTCAWAVGEINVLDSSGKIQNPPYNIARWDGKKWLLGSVSFPLYGFDCSIAGSYFGRGVSVYAFDASNVVLTDGGSIIKWNGTSYSNYPCAINVLNGAIKKLWGTSPNDLYAVGTNGTMIHYAGSNWTKLESGTSATINDIWGVNQRTGERTILCAVSEFLSPGDRRILSITPQNIVDTVAWTPQREIRSVWFQSSRNLFTAGEGIFQRNFLNQWKEFTATPRIYSNRVRGTALNDIVAVGEWGMVLHYNGSTWQYYDEFYGNLLWHSSDYKNRTLMAGGYAGSGVDGAAIILYGKHN